MDKGELPVIPQRRQGGESRVQPESVVERQGSLIRSGTTDRDRRTNLVIGALGIGHDNVEPIDVPLPHHATRFRLASSGVVPLSILIHSTDKIETGTNLCHFPLRTASVAPADRA